MTECARTQYPNRKKVPLKVKEKNLKRNECTVQYAGHRLSSARVINKTIAMISAFTVMRQN
jgi:hypothetical protein